MKQFLLVGIIFLSLFACKSNKRDNRHSNYSPHDSTQINVRWNSLTYVITSAEVYLRNNNLSLTMLKDNCRMFDMEFGLKNSKWVCSSFSEPALNDCLFVSSQIRFLEQKVSIEPRNGNGDRLKGIVDMVLLGKKAMFREPLIPFVDSRKWDTIIIKGEFYSKIH